MIATDLCQCPDLALALSTPPAYTASSPMLGGSAEKSHPDVVKGKPAPGQNICCIGYLSEIKTKNRKLKIQGLGKAITDRGGGDGHQPKPLS